MGIFKKILSFFKSLFTKKDDDGTTIETVDGNCDECTAKSVCQTVDRSKKFALVVGMENSKWGACPGSNKDATVMNGLVGNYVDSTHIVKLGNSTATRAAVWKSLNDQIAKVPEDGLFIFTYSGHGGQMNKSSSAQNETDGRDEFLCLYDGYILDDELWEAFNKCKGRVFVVFDCCHSGTMYRLPNEEQDATLGDEENRLPLDAPFFNKFQNVRGTLKMLVISGCGEETVSWGDSVNGGVLTAAFKKNFNKCLSYRELWLKVKSESSFKSVKQVPICTNVGGFDIQAKVFN